MNQTRNKAFNYNQGSPRRYPVAPTPPPSLETSIQPLVASSGQRKAPRRNIFDNTSVIARHLNSPSAPISASANSRASPFQSRLRQIQPPSISTGSISLQSRLCDLTANNQNRGQQRQSQTNEERNIVLQPDLVEESKGNHEDSESSSFNLSDSDEHYTPDLRFLNNPNQIFSPTRATDLRRRNITEQRPRQNQNLPCNQRRHIPQQSIQRGPLLPQWNNNYQAPLRPARNFEPRARYNQSESLLDQLEQFQQSTVNLVNNVLHRNVTTRDREEFKQTSNGLSAEGLKRQEKRGYQTEEEPGICSICLKFMMKGDKVHYLVCNHIFHVNCIKPWFAENHICPYCRNDLNEDTLPAVISQ